MLSLAPLLILTLALVSLVVGVTAAREQLVAQFRDLLGPTGGDAVQTLLQHAQSVHASSIASIVGLAMLLFSASQVFAELQSALNKIWETAPSMSNGVWVVIRQRFFSFGLVLSIGLLLLISLMMSAALAAAGKFLGGALPAPEGMLHALDSVLPFAVTSGLFALVLQYVPDARTAWRDIWAGAIITAALFTAGKLLIGLYLGKAGIGSAYGEAGSIVAVIVWVYYASQIFFFGAELAHVLAVNHRTTIAGGAADPNADPAAAAAASQFPPVIIRTNVPATRP